MKPRLPSGGVSAEPFYDESVGLGNNANVPDDDYQDYENQNRNNSIKKHKNSYKKPRRKLGLSIGFLASALTTRMCKYASFVSRDAAVET